jgi:hypothetical protein
MDAKKLLIWIFGACMVALIALGLYVGSFIYLLVGTL